jgi:membrane-associated protein
MLHILTTFSEPLIYLLAFSIVLLETGVAPFFFLPGDSLLFSLGLFAHQGLIRLEIIIPVLILSGFIGNLIGYHLGSFVREKHHTSKLLKTIPDKYITKTELFYQKYGSWTIFISRFIPVVRTVAPFLAGVSKMNYKKFVILSLVGAIFWSAIVTTTGFLFGSYVKVGDIMYIALALMLTASILTPILLILSKKYMKRG